MAVKNPLAAMGDNLRDVIKEKALDPERVKCTSDYSIFKKHKINRKVDENSSHFKHLMQSIEKHNLLSLNPILVNERMEVINGQHRLEAAKQLGLQIYYIISKHVNDQDIMLLNANQKEWSLLEKMQGFVEGGNNHYIRFKEFIEANKFKIVEGLLALNDGRKRGVSMAFKNGEFKFPDEDTMTAVNWKLERYHAVIGLMRKKSLEIPTYLKNSHFRTALLHFLERPEVMLETFMTRIEMRLETIRRSTSQGAYLIQFEEIYNYHNKNKIDLNNILREETKKEIVQEEMFK